jgi:hypothetical protein
MDDLIPRTEATCPVAGCPWKYELSRPRTEVRPGGRVALVVPPPAGDRTAAETVAGVRAAGPVMACAPPPVDIAGLVDVVGRAASAQDEAVLATHLGTHTRAELAAGLGDRLDFALAALDAAGVQLADSRATVDQDAAATCRKDEPRWCDVGLCLCGPGGCRPSRAA